MERAKQFDLFPESGASSHDDRPPEAPPPREEEEQIPLSPEGIADAPPMEERIASPSRAAREARKRRRKAIMDDTAARLGLPGQLLSNDESPFARARREIEEERRRRRKS
ncbi:hypothetical protein HY480_04500 [Candidatus Uhrbacteria bacterium]|nr:hypothetical protein [Candidatus Uhrbacteria bacterium]